MRDFQAFHGNGSGAGKILLVRFVRQRTTEIGGGENSGRIAHDANGVTGLTTLGAWSGAAQRFDIEPPQATEGIAVLVQASDGNFLGAAVMANP